MAKVDMSATTFVMVHNCIGMNVIDKLGSDEQRNRILPDCMKFKKIVAFGLSEA
jgi:alkylation response protein AidB-like acyl-CoA dehydrogenase